ncbi:MAG: alpha/beta hydrolase [Thermoleophilaceae bacterium]
MPLIINGNAARTDGGELPHVPGCRHSFVDAGRVRLHVAEAGDGEPLVLLHGWPQHWYMWREVIPRLATHARVICPDLRGFGWSAVPAGGYDKETMAGDVLALLDALGLERVKLAGHDWGGWIGFLLAMREPERVERLLALGIPTPWRGRDPRGVLALWRLAYQLALSTPRLGGGPATRAITALTPRDTRGALAGEDLAVFTDRLTGERGRATELLYRTFVLRELVPVALGRYSPAQLRVPTLLLFGERDVVIPVRSVRSQAVRCGALELEVVPDVGHFIVDERPKLVAERALSFLLGRPADAGVQGLVQRTW